MTVIAIDGQASEVPMGGDPVYFIMLSFPFPLNPITFVDCFLRESCCVEAVVEEQEEEEEIGKWERERQEKNGARNEEGK